MMTAPAKTSSPDAHKEALYAAAQAALEEAKTRAQAGAGRKRTPGSRVILLALGLALLSLGVYLIGARPAWFFIPDPAPEPVEIQEASLRLTLVREAERVRHYRAATGRLPATLEEAGSQVVGLTYVRQPNATFTISAPLGGSTLALASTDSTAAFLGNSLQLIMRRGGQ